MGWQLGFFEVADRLQQLSAKGDDLERISRLMDFELCRTELDQAVPR